MFSKKNFFNLILIISFSNITILFQLNLMYLFNLTVNRASKTLSDNINKRRKNRKLKKLQKKLLILKVIGFIHFGPYRKSLNDDQKKKYL